MSMSVFHCNTFEGKLLFNEICELFMFGCQWGFERFWIGFFSQQILINILQQRTFYKCLHPYQIQQWISPKLTLIVLSADPVTNHWLPGSTAMDLTQPRWPLMTYDKKNTTVTNRCGFQFTAILFIILIKKKTETKAGAGCLQPSQTHARQFPRSMPLRFGHGRRFPHQWGVSSTASFHEWLKTTRPLLALHCVWDTNSWGAWHIWFLCLKKKKIKRVTYKGTGLRMGPLSSSSMSMDLSHTGCRATCFLPKRQTSIGQTQNS